MVLWITRGDGGAIMSGGLSALSVWPKKPSLNISVDPDRFKNHFKKKYLDLHGIDVEMRGIENWPDYVTHHFGSWTMHGTPSSLHPTSFSKLFGYNDKDTEDPDSDELDNVIAEEVWEIVKKEFNNDDFDNWFDIDNNEEALHTPKTFLLKLKITGKGYVLEEVYDQVNTHYTDSARDEPF
jgi:hypothetical protein